MRVKKLGLESAEWIQSLALPHIFAGICRQVISLLSFVGCNELNNAYLTGLASRELPEEKQLARGTLSVSNNICYYCSI